MPLEKFAAHLELGDHALTVNRVAARVGGGTTQGEWKIDWSGSQPRYTGSGSMEGVVLERVSPQNTVAGSGSAMDLRQGPGKLFNPL